jgi:hypothetical protein
MMTRYKRRKLRKQFVIDTLPKLGYAVEKDDNGRYYTWRLNRVVEDGTETYTYMDNWHYMRRFGDADWYYMNKIKLGIDNADKGKCEYQNISWKSAAKQLRRYIADRDMDESQNRGGEFILTK